MYNVVLKYLKQLFLGETLQKKWRNIRDCFVKAHKAKTTMSGSAAKKKIPYVFYNSLLFLKDTISINSTTSKVTVKSEEANNDDAGLAANVSWTPKHKAKKHDDNGKELIGKLKSNVANETCEDDGDRLFFLSLVKEFRKIPDHLQLQTKLDLLKVIKDAQCPEYPHESWDYAKPNKPHRGYQTAHHSRTKPYFLPMQSHEIRRSPTQEPEVQILEIFSSEDSSAS